MCYQAHFVFDVILVLRGININGRPKDAKGHRFMTNL